jgi:dTDP-4-dehydrorhamnose reductase
MMGKKVLVTGGTGLLGVPLAAFLAESGYAVLTHGRGTKSSDLAFDLKDKTSVLHHLDQNEPEAIVNLVALTNVDRCEDSQLAYLENVRTVENLADWVKQKAATRKVPLIQISTDQVYDGPGEKTESEVTILNTYAFSKFCAEQVVAQVGGISLRTNFFGKSRVPGRDSFSDWVVKALSRGDSLRLFSDIFFSPLSIETLAKAIETVVRVPTPGVYNVGSHFGLSKSEFSLHLAKRLGLATDRAEVVESLEGGLIAKRPKDMRMNCQLFEKTFGIELPKLSDEIDLVGEQYEI